MSRHEFSVKTKLAAWERCRGHCELCGFKIIGRAEYDHVIANALGGEPTLSNCECLCSKCHGLKTFGGDIPRIAKAKRQQRSHTGAKRTTRPMPGSRASKWKKLMSGTVERRNDERDNDT